MAKMAAPSLFRAFRNRLIGGLALAHNIGPMLKTYGEKYELVPAAFVAAIAPLLLWHFKSKPKVVQADSLLWSKLSLAIALAVAEATVLVTPQGQPAFSPGKIRNYTSPNCVAAASLVALLYFEHRHTLRSTASMFIWLVLTISIDVARLWGSFHHLAQLNGTPMITAACICIRCTLLLLEELPKRSGIISDQLRNTVSREATSGFLTGSCLLWLPRTFAVGFRNALSIEQLEDLDPEFSTQRLFNNFTPKWSGVNKKTSHPLARACLETLFVPFLSIIPSRLLCVAFILSQVVFIYDIVDISMSADSNNTQPSEYNLVAAAATIYLGITVCKAVSIRLTGRLSVLTRGIISSKIYEKSLEMYYTQAQAAEAITHMGANIDGLIAGISKVHNIWADIILVAGGTYMLCLLMGYATAVFFVPTMFTLYAGCYFGDRAPTANAHLAQTLKARISAMREFLSRIRAVRMVGLGKVVIPPIQVLHRDEVKYSIAVAEWMVTRLTTLVFCDAITGPFLMMGVLFWTTFSAGISTQEMYAILAVVAVMKSPLAQTVDAYSDLKSTLGFFERIESFLLLPVPSPEGRGQYLEAKYTLPDELSKVRARSSPTHVLSDEQRTPDRVIELRNASVAVQGSDDPVLQNVNLGVNRGQLVVLAGPTGCGKSTLLRSLVGEGQLIAGSLHVEYSQAAYCDQSAWICNSSIRDNIVGGSQVDEEWYNSVIRACQLRSNLQRTAHHDGSMAGSEGSNLSGGQKQLVALARALYLRHPLIVLDDIFASLDPITIRAIFELVFSPRGLLAKTQTTVVIATHALPFLQAADQILVIHSGVTSTLTNYSTDPAIRRHITAVIQGTAYPRPRRPRPGHNSADIPVVEMAQQSTLIAEEEDTARRHGDIQLYKFYLRSFQRHGLVLCLFYTIVAAFTEIVQNKYLHIWLELRPNSYWLYLGYMAVALLSPIFTQLSLNMWFSELVPRSASRLHQMSLDTLMSATFHYMSSTDHGSLLNLFGQDLAFANRGLPREFIVTFYGSFAVAFRAVLVCAASRHTIVVLPAVVGCLYMLQHFFLRTSRQIKHLEAVAKIPLYTQFAETARGLRHIRSFGWQGYSMGKTFKLIDTSQKSFYYMQSIQQWLVLAVDTITFLSVIVLVILARHFKLPGSGIGLSMVSLIPMNGDTSKIIQQWTKLEESMGSVARMRNFIEKTPVESKPGKNAIAVPQKGKENGRVIFNNVVAKYNTDDESPALNSVSFVVPAGWKVGIVGRAGSGKSSLLLTLLNFLDYTGRITIDGVDLSNIPRDILRSKVITTVSQDSIDFDESVKYNLCPWTMSVSEEEEGNPNNLAMELLLTELGLWDAIGGEPGLYKKVSELGLSHGQKQLLSIARGCMQHMTFDGNIVLMDEVTSNLDPDTQDNVVRVLKEVFGDATVFMVAHRPQAIKGVDMILNVEDGRVFTTEKQDSDRLQRERREAERRNAPPQRFGWTPGNYPPELAYLVQMAEYNDAQHLAAQRRRGGPSRR